MAVEMTTRRDYTVEQAATLLQVHPNTIRNYIKAGELECYSISLSGGGEKRIYHESLDEFRQRRRIPARQT